MKQSVFPEQQAHEVAVGITNLRKIYEASTKLERITGLHYYFDFHRDAIEVGAKFAVPVCVIAGMYASLSPSNTEINTWIDLIRVLRACVSNSELPIVHTYNHCRTRAAAIYKTQQPDPYLKGLKVWNFYNNIYQPENDRYVTIDGHMFNCWGGERRALRLSLKGAKHYELVAGNVIALAREYGLLPHQLQATLWTTWRRIVRLDSGQLRLPYSIEEIIR